MRPSADDVIAALGLKPLAGEGGFYLESYRTDWDLTPAAMPGDYPAVRVAATAIYFLITPDDFSALHRLRGDELWHFYLGDPVELALIHPDGELATLRMGHDLVAGERPQALAPGGTWLGCSLVPGGAWALMGTTMTPGFDQADFELADRDHLTAQFPHAANLIARLTRPVSA